MSLPKTAWMIMGLAVVTLCPVAKLARDAKRDESTSRAADPANPSDEETQTARGSERLRRLVSLGTVATQRGQFAHAEELFRAAVREAHETGAGGEQIAKALFGLAYAVHFQGRHSEDETLAKQALAAGEKSLVPDHPETAVNLSKLAWILYSHAKLEEAEPMFKQALWIREKSLGSEHPDVALCLNNLAAIYFVQGRFAAAEPLAKRSLRIVEKAWGHEHPAVAADLDTLAEIYSAGGRYPEAEPLYKQSLAITEKVLGSEHPALILVLKHYAAFLRKTGRSAEAEKLEDRAAAIQGKTNREPPSTRQAAPAIACTWSDEFPRLQKAQGSGSIRGPFGVS